MVTKIEDIPQINKSIDLSIFKFMDGNRQRKSAHIRKLIEAIDESPESIKYTPILVNENYEVIDGQHRLEALRILNKPVYFIQSKGLALKDAQNLNRLAKPWTPVDYAESYAGLGKRNYTFYLALKDKYGLNHDVLMRYISLNKEITGELFRSGHLKAPDQEKTLDLAEKLLSLYPYYPRCKTRSCALAFKTMYEHPDYSHERFLMKLSKAPGNILDHALPSEYLRDFEDLYNHALEENKKVRFYK